MAAASLKTEMTPSSHVFPDRDQPSNAHKSLCGVLRPTRFATFTELSMEIPITTCLPFFFRTNGIFYPIIVSHTLDRGNVN